MKFVPPYGPYSAFSEYYLRSPGILNDPFCCMTLLVIEWSHLQRRCHNRCSKDCQCFWMLGQPPKISLSLGYRVPPPNTWYLGPARVIKPNGISIGSAVFVWSPVSCRSSVGQGKFANHKPTFYHCATQPASFCLCVCLFFRTIHRKPITKPDIEMFDDESWKSIYFRVKRSNVKFTSHEKTLLVCVFALLWALASCCQCTDTPPSLMRYSGERAAVGDGFREAGRLRRRWSADGHPEERQGDVRRNTVLDGTGSHHAETVRLQGRILSSRDLLGLSLRARLSHSRNHGGLNIQL